MLNNDYKHDEVIFETEIHAILFKNIYMFICLSVQNVLLTSLFPFIFFLRESGKEHEGGLRKKVVAALSFSWKNK